MFKLLESRPERRRSASATLVSVVAHSAVIAGVVVGTATGEPRAAEPSGPTIIFHPTPAPAPLPGAPTSPAGPVPQAPETPEIVVAPVDVPIHIPTLGDAARIPGRFDLWPGDGVLDGSPNGPTLGASGPGPIPFDAGQVDRPVVPLGGTRVPRYPDILRRARTEGVVVATFVVDTLGRVEPASFRTGAASHPLFEESVRSAVLAMRFRPAEAAGRRVRQLVEQRFIFTLSP